MYIYQHELLTIWITLTYPINRAKYLQHEIAYAFKFSLSFGNTLCSSFTLCLKVTHLSFFLDEIRLMKHKIFHTAPCTFYAT